MTGRNKRKKASLKIQLTVIVGALAFIICSGLGVMMYLDSTRVLQETIENSLELVSVQGGAIVAKELDKCKAVVEAIAAAKELTQDGPIEDKMQFLKDEAEQNGYLRMTLADMNGRGTTTEGETPDLSEQEYFKLAAGGKTNVSDLLVEEDGNSAVVVVAAPIKDGGSIKGVLTAAFDGRILSEITNKIVYAKDGYAFMLNKDAVKIAHYNYDLVMNRDNDLENVKKDPSLQSLVDLEKKMIAGEMSTGKYTYNGITKFMGYATVPGTSWSIGVTAPEEEVFAGMYNLRRDALILSLLFLLASMGIAFAIALWISRPVIAMTKTVEKMTAFDLTAGESAGFIKATGQTNEIGTIARSIRDLKNEFHNIIKGVRAESQEVMDSVDTILVNIGDLNSGIQDVSATTEELSAGMEETAASTQEMSATSHEIESAVESIASRAQEGAFTASAISRKAEELSSSFSESQKNARVVFDRTSEKLNKALEDSKSVEQINSLSDTIMQITAQTNLLALNAAIEAARAGESGKGFAVVAEEIRKLAEDSKAAVTQIQQVIKTVISSVDNLASSSNELLRFVSKDVGEDYKLMLHATEQYNEDASSVSSMIMDLSATSEELLASIQNMLKAINEVTAAANEGAEGTANIAARSSDIVNRSAEMVAQVDKSQKCADRLIKLVSKFKV